MSHSLSLQSQDDPGVTSVHKPLVAFCTNKIMLLTLYNLLELLHDLNIVAGAFRWTFCPAVCTKWYCPFQAIPDYTILKPAPKHIKKIFNIRFLKTCTDSILLPKCSVPVLTCHLKGMCTLCRGGGIIVIPPQLPTNMPCFDPSAATPRYCDVLWISVSHQICPPNKIYPVTPVLFHW